MSALMMAIAAVLRPAAPSTVDGTNTWTARTNATSGAWQSLAYGNGVFVAPDNNSTSGNSSTSTDGASWTTRSMPSGAYWFSVVFGNGIFVALGVNSGVNYATTSTDGITWTSKVTLTAPSGAPGQSWKTVVAAGSVFVLLSNGTGSAYSTDGASWTAGGALPSTDNWNVGGYGNGVLVAVASGASGSNACATSTDGAVTWTAHTMPYTVQWQSLAFGNGVFVATSANGTNVASSAYGATWTGTTVSASSAARFVAFGNGVFVTVTYHADESLVSRDGVSWLPVTLPSAANWFSICYGTGAVFAASTVGLVTNMASGSFGPNMFNLKLTGTLPAATVGTAWNGVLNFTGDYTGTLTIDASSGTIPSWMGTPTIDYTAKTVTWSATPATGVDASSPYTFTPRATDSASQIAVGSAQSVAVSAAVSASIVSKTGATTGTTTLTQYSTFSISAGSVNAGDTIVLFVNRASNSASNTFTVADNVGSTYAAGPKNDASTGSIGLYSFVGTATTSGTLSVSVTPTAAGCTATFEVYVLRGGLTLNTTDSKTGYRPAYSGTPPLGPNTYSVSARAALLVDGFVFASPTDASRKPSLADSSGLYATDVVVTTGGYGISLFASRLSTAAISGETLTMPFTTNPSGNSPWALLVFNY